MINERQGLYMALINTINVTLNEHKDVRYNVYALERGSDGSYNPYVTRLLLYNT